MIERLVLTNLRRAQSFDASLRSASTLETIAASFIDAVMYNPNPQSRGLVIANLKKQLISHITDEVFPQAERIGQQNAKDIAAKVPKPAEPLSDREIQLALFEGKERASQRLKIVQSSIDASGSTLDSRLTRYWLEPAEGNAEQKLKRLQEIYTRLEDKRTTFETNVRKFYSGEIKSRPTKPNLDYMSAFTSDVKTETRTQARRSGTDAEVSLFKSRGQKNFIWIVPNGSSACPDCRKRQNVVLTMDQWEQYGRPGSGLTVCGSNCFCMLLPDSVANVSPSLLNRVNTREPGPMTNSSTLDFFNKHRKPAQAS